MPGRECWCGKTNCLETWLSGAGVSLDYREKSGAELCAKEIIERARAGDEAAIAVRTRFIHRLSRAIAVVSNILDPDIFVLGGGLSNINEIYEEAPEIVARYVFSDDWRSVIAPAKWGDSSGVRGAAQLWPLGVAREPVMRNVTEINR